MAFSHWEAEEKTCLYKEADDMDAATHVTVGDRQRLRRSPPPCSRTLQRLLDMLRNYL